MIEDTALLEKREELKHQLAAGEYKALIEVMLDETGRLLQKLTRSREPVSFWYGAVVVGLITLLIGFLASIVFGEFDPARPEAILWDISKVGMAFAGVIAAKIAQDILLTTLRDRLLDAIRSAADLADLQRWLAAHYDTRKQLLFCLAYAVLLTSYAAVMSTAEGGFVGFGAIILEVITSFQSGMLLYLFLPIMTFLARLGHYQIKLYAADPGSSELIDHLSDMVSNEAFIGVALSAIATVVYALLDRLTLATAIVLVIAGWAPCIVVFVTGQRALAKAVTRAKWKTLNEIQAKIEKLTVEENIVDGDTTDAMNRLMDLHDRIKVTRNSALDFRAGLRFLNSLLLPLIAFLLSNLDRVLNLFR